MCFILGHSTVYLIIAAIAGLTMALQGSINSILGKKIGLPETTFLVHLTAAIILLLILLFKTENNMMNMFKDIP